MSQDEYRRGCPIYLIIKKKPQIHGPTMYYHYYGFNNSSMYTKNVCIFTVLSKNVIAAINHSRYFHYASNFFSTVVKCCMYIMFDIVDTVFSYGIALVVS